MVPVAFKDWNEGAWELELHSLSYFKTHFSTTGIFNKPPGLWFIELERSSSSLSKTDTMCF